MKIKKIFSIEHLKYRQSNLKKVIVSCACGSGNFIIWGTNNDHAFDKNLLCNMGSHMIKI